jgi:tetratricopeptide (TPR) repeat protein
VWFPAALIVIAFGYGVFRYYMNKSNYENGHKAYQNADCATAIHYFDDILDGWRVLDVDGQPALLAQQQKEDCLPFQAAVDQQNAGNLDQALVAYADFISIHDGSVLVDAARGRVSSLFEKSKTSTLISDTSCTSIDVLLKVNAVPQPDVYLPPFFLSCGQLWDAAKDSQKSFGMYEALLSEYPTYPEAGEAEASLLQNFSTCAEISSLKSNPVIVQRKDFIPSLYSFCGKAYENQKDWSNAITMYDNLLAEYPDYALTAGAEAALARSIVAQASEEGGGVIPAPEKSGNTSTGETEVTIQNDSPEELRIVFSGPESRVEKLTSCGLCQKYTAVGPAYCPTQGPIANYTLQPGEYDVVVESLSDSTIKPWTGNWSLVSGSKYDSCFFIVTTLGP